MKMKKYQPTTLKTEWTGPINKRGIPFGTNGLIIYFREKNLGFISKFRWGWVTLNTCIFLSDLGEVSEQDL